MKKILITLLAVCFFTGSFAQTPISLPAVSPYSENFDVTPGASGTTYPAGWLAYNFATTADNAMIIGNSGTNTGANYNYGSCVGILGSGSNYLPGTIVLAIANTSGKKNFTISYNIKKIREQGRNNTFNLQVGTASPTGSFANVTGGTYDSGTIPQGTVTAYTNIALPSTIDNSANTVYIRFYYSDIAGSGSRDGIALDDVVLSWSPLGPEINAPVAQSITDISARLGATVTSDGGSTVTQRGIIIGTSPGPAIGQSGNIQVDVPGTTGTFDTVINILDPGTRYYFRGFAVNASGTAYTDDVSFFTLSTRPSAAANLTATAISNHDIRLDWTPASLASGYVVLQKLYTAPTSFPVNATQYTEGIALGDAEIVDTILDGSAGTRTYSSLISGTVYQYAVIPYRYNGTNTETYHYNTDAIIPIAFDTTWGVGPSAISDLVGIAQSEAPVISSVINGALNASADGIRVWQLALRDGGSALSDVDNMPTTINRITITKGANNHVANWQSVLAGAALFDDSTGAKLGDAVIYSDSLVFTSLSFEAQDDNQKTVTLRVTLKTNGIADGDSFQFAIKKQYIQTPWLNSSSQIPVLDIQSDSTRNVIDVIATRLVIVQQPAATLGVNTFLTPSVLVELQDSNGNKDRYNTGTYQLISSVATLKYACFANPVAGVLTFDSVHFVSLAKGNILKVFGQGLDTAYSDPMSIFASSASIIRVAAGFVYMDSIPYLDYQSATITSANAVPVFGMTMLDGGVSLNDPDLFGTKLNTLSVNVTNATYVRTLALYQGGTKLGEQAVTSGQVKFTNVGAVCADDDSLSLTLYATFNSRYAHGQRVVFTVSNVAADTATGSVFAAVDGGGASSSVNGANNVLKYKPVYVVPPVAIPVSICAGSNTTLTAVKQPGTVLRWFETATGNTPVYSGDSFAVNSVLQPLSYYVAADSAGWLSAKTKIDLTIREVSDPVTSPVTVCRGNSITLAVTSPYQVNWYRSLQSPSSLASGLTFTPAQVTTDTLFYVQADSGGCYSSKVPVKVTLTKVSVPAIADTLICNGMAATLTGSGVHPLSWFNTASASAALFTGNIFTSGVITRDTTFYYESDSAGCKSPRLPVRVSVQHVADPVLSTDSTSVCSGTMAVITASSEVNWYETFSATSPVSVNDSLVTPALFNDVTYYAAYSAGGCSSARIPVKITVNVTPADPVVTADSVCLGSATALVASANSAAVTWYDAPVNGVLLHTGNSFNTPVLNTATTYYVRAAANGCTSATVPVIIGIKTKPATPAVTANVTSCSGLQVRLGASAAGGNTIRWFAGATDTVSIGSDSLLTPVLMNDVSYYAAAYRNGCLSNRQKVNVKVNTTPVADFTINDEEQCLADNQFTFLNATGNPVATQYAWSFGDSTAFAFANPVKSYQAKGEYTVTLKAVNNGCSSVFSKTVKVDAPEIDFTFDVIGNRVTFSPAGDPMTTYHWKFTDTDSLTEQTPEFTFAQNGTYLVTLTVTNANGCKASVSKTVTIIATGISEVFQQLHRVQVYPNPANEKAMVSYLLDRESDVRIELFDLQGRLMEVVLDAKEQQGDQQAAIRLGAYSKGIYLVRISINGVSGTIRIHSI